MSSSRNAFVIGAGSAGIEAAVGLARAGWQVCIAEPSGVGGPCLWAGCVPKKALYETARAYGSLERERRYGVEAGGGTVDWQAAQAWKRASQTAVAGDQERLLRDPRVCEDARSAPRTRSNGPQHLHGRPIVMGAGKGRDAGVGIPRIRQVIRFVAAARETTDEDR
jgi:glutathione reductase (NADPH)